MATGLGDKLAVYIHRAKGSAEAAARAVNQALDDPEVFVFGELLDVESVKALAQGEHSQTHQQLELLAYGTYADWKATTKSPADLSEGRLRKLKQLSLVSLAESARTLSYAKLQADLDLDSVRDLEQLVVSCIYSELVVAVLDQKRQQVEVQRVIGRDVHPSKLPNLLSKLDGWLGACDQLIAKQDAQAAAARDGVAAESLSRDTHVAQRIQRSEQVVQDIESGDLATRRKLAAEKAVAAAGGLKGRHRGEFGGGFADSFQEMDRRFGGGGGPGSWR